MKRILSLFLLLLLALVPVAAVRADGDTCPSSDDGQHNWVVYENPPTCTDTGMREYQCTKCYASRDYETLPALGHDWSAWITRQEATCTAGGTEYRQCSRCPESEIRDTEPLGHAWDNGSVTTAATCAAEGVKTFTCLRCGATRTEAIAKTADHTPVSVPGKAATCTEAGLTDGSKCSTCGATLKAQETIAAKGHSWDGGRVTKEATCTAEGVKTYTCSNCGATKTDSFPAKGHTPATVAGRAATCTEAGLTEGSQCSACGTILKAQETIPAKGHAWDQGVITSEPQGFTPGVKTYTCQNDPSHTYTEPVDPTQSVFNGMSNVIPDFSSGWLMNNPVGDMLRIVTQPQGGVVHTYLDNAGALWYGHMTIYVEAAGGEGDYHYHWYREPALPSTGGSLLTEIFASQGEAVAAVCHEAQTATVSGLNGFYQAWMNQHKLPGVTIAKPATATETGTIQPFNPGQEYLFTTLHPECQGWPGYRYWCVVEDEAGHKAVSEKAEVKNGLHIVRQPESKNIYGRDSVTLTCVAAGGSGPEHQLYNWFDAAGKLLSDESTYMATTTGNYYCKVFDFGTDEVVDAKMARVYYEQIDLRPTITLQPEDVILEYREDGQYSWSMACLALTYDGGSEDLKYEWFGKTDNGWSPIGEGQFLDRSYDHGIFRCRVTDTRNGAYVSSNEAKVSTKMKITDIQTGIVDSSNNQKFEITVVGGEAPYRVLIYKWVQCLHDGGKSWDWKAIVFRDVTIEDPNDMQPFVRWLPNTETQYAFIDGQLRLGNGWPSYDFVIYDANNMSCGSGTVYAN